MDYLLNINKECKNLKKTGDSRYIYQHKLDKACFKHGLAYGDFKKLPRSTASDKILRDKEFDFAKNPKNDRYQHGIVSVVLIKSLLLAKEEELILMQFLTTYN